MAELKCPSCQQERFSWSIDEEESELTKWACRNCGYTAFEDETKEQLCKECGSKSKSKLEDTEREYWWCSNCNETWN